MEGKSKLTKEVVAQEARFILDSLLSTSKFSQDINFEELRRLCEQSVSLRLLDYISFLERFGYLTYDRNTQHLAITADGERVVGGEKVAELVIDVVHHFRPILSKVRSQEAPAPPGARPNRWATGERNEVIDNRYEKLLVIGSGGIGTVYQARQLMLSRTVAFKEIRELFGFFSESQRKEIVRRFEEEVLKASQLCHPNVVTILDANTKHEYPFAVTEYVGGGNLHRVIQYAEEFPADLVVKIFLQILHALGHAHNKGVVHRGIKPENVLFDSMGNVRVTDFGLSKIVEQDQAVIQHVYVGMGSVAYMAPELFNQPGTMGPQSDLYALGILLYEMLARKLPGRRSPMPTKLHPKLPSIIDDIFDKLTQDDLSDRYVVVDEVLEDFYRSDASNDFIEPRGAILFVENPLQHLSIEEKSNEVNVAMPASSLPVASATSLPVASASSLPVASASSLPVASASSLPVASASSLPVASATSQSADEVKIDSLIAKVAKVVKPEVASVSIASSESEPRIQAIALSDSSGESSVAVSESAEDDADKTNKRRGRSHRPYSFQQRVKERDK